MRCTKVKGIEGLLTTGEYFRCITPYENNNICEKAQMKPYKERSTITASTTTAATPTMAEQQQQ